MSEAKERYFIINFADSITDEYCTKGEAESHLGTMLDSDPTSTMNDIDNGILMVIKGRQVDMESFKVKLEE